MVFQQIEPLVSCSKTESMKGKVLIHPKWPNDKYGGGGYVCRQ